MAKIKLRRDLAATWTSTNPTLAAGEPGYETDNKKIKYGDGTTAWTSLGYAIPTFTIGTEGAASGDGGALRRTGAGHPHVAGRSAGAHAEGLDGHRPHARGEAP